MPNTHTHKNNNMKSSLNVFQEQPKDPHLNI